MPNELDTLDYTRIAEELAKALVPHLRGTVFKQTSVVGAARITFDDCADLAFTCGGLNFKFSKAGKDSWVETVKHSHRTKAPIYVGYDDTITNPDGSFVPRDIHDA